MAGSTPPRALQEGFSLAFETPLDPPSKAASRRILRAASAKPGLGGGGGWGRKEEEQGCEQEGRRGIGGALRAGE